MGWVSPTGHNDPDNKWTQEGYAYDNNLATAAMSDLIAAGNWSPFLVVTHAGLTCDEVRIMVVMAGKPAGCIIDLDAEYDGTYHHVYQGAISDQTWLEKEILDGTKTVTAIRARQYNDDVLSHNFWFYEFDFWEVIVAPTVTTQAATSVQATTARLNGQISDDGGEACQYRFRYKKSGGSYSYTSWTGAKTTGQTFYEDISGLDKKSLYYFNAQAKNSAGESAWGAELNFTTLATAPVVTTQAVSDIGGTTATGHGNITDIGGENASKRGVCWNTTGNPTVADSKSEETDSFGVGAFTRPMTGLTPGQHYYVRAYAYNSAGYGYGSQVEFDTVEAPTVTTQAVTGIGATTATGNGTIAATGGENCTKRGVCWNTTGNPTVADSKSEETDSFGTGDFTRPMTGLTPEQHYYVKAYAYNSAGYGYGSQVEFDTPPPPPAAPTNVQATDGAHTDKVVITWTKSAGATGYQVYRDGVPLGWLGDVATYNDAGAGAPFIIPGSSVASDGAHTYKVALSLSGAETNNGTTHTYKVRARNAGGESPDSATDTGYRAPGSLTYQWRRSAADSDAGYSDISGATTASYDDYGAPVDGSGRYYRCRLNAAGAAQQYSAPDRGYRLWEPPPVPVVTEYQKREIARIGAEAEATLAAIFTLDLTKLIPIAKAAIFNIALPAAEADWLGSDIEPTNSPSYLRIYVCVSVTGILRVVRTQDATPVTEDLNSGTALVADAAYMFTVPWRTGDNINIRYSVTTGTIKRLLIDEIGAAE